MQPRAKRFPAFLSSPARPLDGGKGDGSSGGADQGDGGGDGDAGDGDDGDGEGDQDGGGSGDAKDGEQSKNGISAKDLESAIQKALGPVAKQLRHLGNFRNQVARHLKLKTAPLGDLDDSDDGDDADASRQGNQRQGQKGKNGKGDRGEGRSDEVKALRARMEASEKRRTIAEAMASVEGISPHAKPLIRKLIEASAYTDGESWYVDSDEGEPMTIEEAVEAYAENPAFKRGSGNGGPQRRDDRRSSSGRTGFAEVSADQLENMSDADFAAWEKKQLEKRRR